MVRRRDQAACLYATSRDQTHACKRKRKVGAGEDSAKLPPGYLANALRKASPDILRTGRQKTSWQFAMVRALTSPSHLAKLVGFVAGVCTAQLLLELNISGAKHQEKQQLTGVNCPLSSQSSGLTTEATADSPARSNSSNSSSRPHVRIFCLILTHPKQYHGMAVSVNNTWARRCDKYYFVGSEKTNVNIPMLYLPLVESRQILWKKVRMAFMAIHDQENLDNFDYFLKADDDTYVVMENLRSLLRGRDPNEAAAFGRRFAYQGDKRQQYMSGGAGYVLSRRALRLLVGEGFRRGVAPKGTDYCNILYIWVEDYLMGRCLQQIGVKFEDSLDEQRRERFHPLRPETMVNPKMGPDWMKQYSFHPFEKCVTCISNTSVTFHYVENAMELEFLLYHMRVAD